MKYLLLILALATGPALAEDSQWFRPWTQDDIGREQTYLALKLMDWGQTREIAKNDKFYERNRILGSSPTTKQVDRYFIISTLAQLAIADALPAKYRVAFQRWGITLQTAMVVHNYSIGLSMRW